MKWVLHFLHVYCVPFSVDTFNYQLSAANLFIQSAFSNFHSNFLLAHNSVEIYASATVTISCFVLCFSTFCCCCCWSSTYEFIFCSAFFIHFSYFYLKCFADWIFAKVKRVSVTLRGSWPGYLNINSYTYTHLLRISSIQYIYICICV